MQCYCYRHQNHQRKQTVTLKHQSVQSSAQYCTLSLFAQSNKRQKCCFFYKWKKITKRIIEWKQRKKKKSDELDALKIVMFVRVFFAHWIRWNFQFFFYLSRIFNSEWWNITFFNFHANQGSESSSSETAHLFVLHNLNLQ